MGRVRRTGVRRRVGGLTVIVAPGAAELPRVAFVAGRSVGSAVRRNRAKRRLREAMRQARLRPDHDYVVIASARVVDAPFAEVAGWVREGIEGS